MKQIYPTNRHVQLQGVSQKGMTKKYTESIHHMNPKNVDKNTQKIAETNIQR